MNPLPPQAYTKDTLIQAYAWLQDQNDHVKEMAKSPDILVGLFLKAKHNGAEALERPSIQNFKNELKSLAGIMHDFETKNPAPPAVMATAITPPTQASTAPVISHSLSFKPSEPSSSFIPETSKADLISFLDPKTRAQVEEIKSELNLSCHEEVLRLIVSVGFKALKKL